MQSVVNIKVRLQVARDPIAVIKNRTPVRPLQRFHGRRSPLVSTSAAFRDVPAGAAAPPLLFWEPFRRLGSDHTSSAPR